MATDGQYHPRMQEQPIFRTASEAIDVLFTMTARLANVVMWLAFAVAHLALVCVALLAMWAFQVTPTDALAWFQTWQNSMPVAALAFVGVSVLSVLSAYLWVLRKLHRHVGTSWLFQYLIESVSPRQR